MKSPLVRWLLALNALVLCGVLLASFVQRHHQQQAQQTRRLLADKMVQRSLKNDDATPIESAQLGVIGKSVDEGRALTDDQFSFLMAQASKPNSKEISTLSQMTALAILELMHYKMKAPLPASQQAMFSNRLVSLLQVPDPTDSSVFTLTEMHKLEACHLLALYDVREAIPQIVPLLDDPKARVRNDAKQALKKLGYST